MKIKRAILFGLAISFASSAHADQGNINVLSLSDEGSPVNFIQQDVIGDNNTLSIEQTLTDSAMFGNTIEVSITGDRNGGRLDSAFPSLFRSTGMTPGRLVQSGEANRMRININGSSNLFAASQIGNQNQLTAFVSGSSNQFAVQQIGHGNIANLSQVGNGNVISIIQRSR